MNCSDFQQRMQDLIDERVSLVGDDQLCAHARRCNECHQRMALWQQVDSVLAAGQSRQQVKPREIGGTRLAACSIIASVAAVLLLAFFASLSNDERVVNNLAVSTQQTEDQRIAVDPALWWRNVQEQDWIGQTMPAVHSVRDGVAPLGRSLLQAVAILTNGRGESTS